MAARIMRNHAGISQAGGRIGADIGIRKAPSLTPFSAPLRLQRSTRTAVVPLGRTKSGSSRTAVAPLARAKTGTEKIKRNLAYVKPKYDTSATQTYLLEPAFTRRREVFVGRLAMTGFFAALVGEMLTGKGAIGQLALETQLPPGVIKAVVAGIVIFNGIVALNPAGTTFSPKNLADIRKRPIGALQCPSISATSNPRQFLGISEKFGFTKKNELFVGRVAMLGFAAELIGFNMPMFQQLGTYGLAGWALFFFAAAVGSGTFPGQAQGDEEIY